MSRQVAMLLRRLAADGKLGDADESEKLIQAGARFARATPGDREPVSHTLSHAGLDAIAHLVLVEEMDLPEAGRLVSGYKTDEQARAFAVGQLVTALRMMVWHRAHRQHEVRTLLWAKERIERDRVQKRAKEAFPADHWK